MTARTTVVRNRSGCGNRYSLRNDRGQATVEFALCAILFLTIMCAVFEFSWVYYNYSYLNNWIEKAARLGVTGGTNTQISTCVITARGGMAINAPTIGVMGLDGVSVTNTDRTPGNLLTVSATITYPNLTPLSRLVKMSTFRTLQASCTVRIE